MKKCDLTDVVLAISDNYHSSNEIFFTDPNRHMPRRNVIIEILKDIRNIMFPGYFSNGAQATPDAQYFIGNTILRVEHDLVEQVREALLFRDGDKMTFEEIDERAREVSSAMLCKIPSIQQLLYKDIQAAFDGDPAAQSKEEIIYSYPGFFAIWVYRIAHELYKLDVPLVPRIMTEYAHSRTGVDINAGAEIGEYFFIDHATGVVIGETTKIGNQRDDLRQCLRTWWRDDNRRGFGHRWFGVRYAVSTAEQPRLAQEPGDQRTHFREVRRRRAEGRRAGVSSCQRGQADCLEMAQCSQGTLCHKMSHWDSPIDS